MELQNTKKAFIDRSMRFVRTKKPLIRKHWKKLLLIGVPVVLIFISILKPDGFNEATETVEIAQIRDLKKTVEASGTITSVVDLGLGFNTPGTVQSVSATVGKQVTKGQVLATLNAQTELGTLNQALGALKAAQAALMKIQEGATSEEVAVTEAQLKSAEIDLENTTKKENLAVINAFRTLTSTGLVAIPKDGGATTTNAPTISGTYTGEMQGEYIVSISSSQAGYTYSVSGLGSSTGVVTTDVPQPLGAEGLFIDFSDISGISNARWAVKVPNTQSSTYVTNLNAYTAAQENRDSAIRSAEAIVNQRKAELALKKAAARPADLALKEADVISAEGRVQTAQGAYEDKVVRAPANGTITKVDIKPGESVDAKKVVIVLQDTGELFLEANVNESAISDLRVGQVISFTVDTSGPEQIFTAILSHIDLAPTLDGDIVNYKIKAQVQTGLDTIKTGGTANASVLISEKAQVVTLPSRVVFERDGKKYVLLVTDERKGKTKEQEVVLGQTGDGGLVEIVSGVSVNDKVLFRTK